MLIFGGVHVDILGVGWIYLSRIMARVTMILVVFQRSERQIPETKVHGKIQSIYIYFPKKVTFCPPISGIFRDPQWWDRLMGMVWEAYHKGVPLLGVPEISLDPTLQNFSGWKTWMATIKAVHFVELLQKHLKIGQSWERVKIRCLWRVGLS